MEGIFILLEVVTIIMIALILLQNRAVIKNSNKISSIADKIFYDSVQNEKKNVEDIDALKRQYFELKKEFHELNQRFVELDDYIHKKLG